LARFLYTAVSVWLRLLPSGASGILVVGEQGTLTGVELVAGEILGAGVGTGAGWSRGTDLGSGTETGFGTLTGTGSDFETDGGSGFGALTGAG